MDNPCAKFQVISFINLGDTRLGSWSTHKGLKCPQIEGNE